MIQSLTIVDRAGDGVGGVGAVDVDVGDGGRTVGGHTGVIQVGLDGVGIGREGVDVALLEQLNASVHLGNDTDFDLVEVVQVGVPVGGILLVDLDGVILPGSELVGAAADEVIQVGTVGGGQTVVAQALIPHLLVDGNIVTVVEVLLDGDGIGVLILGGQLDGVLVDLLDTDFFPGLLLFKELCFKILLSFPKVYAVLYTVLMFSPKSSTT